MTVYHGGFVEVTNPEIRMGKYVGDFGIGFYTTSSIEQARRFVKTKGWREGRMSGVVSIYELDEHLFTDAFSGLVFTGPTREWADFVLKNRQHPDFQHSYDYVRGPVANDQVYASFALFESGIISFEELISRLKVRKLFDQILFHTEASLSLLSFTRSESVSWQR